MSGAHDTLHERVEKWLLSGLPRPLRVHGERSTGNFRVGQVAPGAQVSLDSSAPRRGRVGATMRFVEVTIFKLNHDIPPKGRPQL